MERTLKTNLIIFILLLSYIVPIHAKQYNLDLLQIHATVFPKILLTDTQLKKKLIQGAVKIIILYSKADRNTAEQLKKNILSLYSTINHYPLHIYLKEYTSFQTLEPATAYYQLYGNKNAIIRVNKAALKNAILTFSYTKSYLSYGTIFSLHIGKNVVPIINISALKKSKIILNNIIFTIAKTQ